MTSSTTVAVFRCPKNLQPYLGVSRGCRKPFKDVEIIFFDKCMPIFAAKAFFAWKCKEDCGMSHIQMILCPKHIDTQFSDKMSCTCQGNNKPDVLEWYKLKCDIGWFFMGSIFGKGLCVPAQQE
uniref:Uncharacterized protein n=1 Tax=Romanomermis culicivorax TaxID=13658 RepID=A0A915K5E8_ROMCU